MCSHIYVSNAGKYPDSPKLPAIAGNEGVAEILECGSNVKNFKVGDRIIPFTNLLGTWRTHALLSDQLIMKVPAKMGIVEAATLTVNPPSAYRMLKDYVDVHKDDTVIQNGANSAVGQMVIQMCRIWGIKCVGIVRNRPNLDELIGHLKSLGASEILTEEQLRTTTLFKSGALNKPKLALNCVGGKSSTEMLRHLDAKGVMVTYGAMSREPVTAPNAALIFKDISFRGFWMSRWNKEHPRDEIRFAMVEDLVNWYAEGKLRAPVHHMVPFEQYEKALSSALDMKGFASGKSIFDFTATAK